MIVLVVMKEETKWRLLPEPSDKSSEDFHRKYKKRAKFLVDENLGELVAILLRELDWNAKYVSEVGLLGHPDENVFNYSCKNNLVLLTHDQDFLDDRKFPHQRTPGIAIIPGAEGGNSIILGTLKTFLWMYGENSLYLKGTKVRFYPEGTFSISRLEEENFVSNNTYRFEKRGRVSILE